MAILLDFNPTIISAVSIGDKEFGSDLNENMIRHLVLNMILSYRKQFGSTYGKLIICCDSRNYWRKDYFPYYKFNRKKSREDSPLDWEMIYSALDNIQQELRDYMPYNVVSVPRCEADDIIGVLANYIANYEPIIRGIGEDDQEVLILSRDKDFKQLQVNKLIKQWSPIDKKWLREPDPDLFLIEQIIRGDASDGVPNMLSDDDSFVIKKRQKPVRETLVQSIIEKGVPPEHKIGYDRNKRMIDLTQIPDEIQQSIIDEYKKHKPNPKTKILSYMVDKGLKNLYDQANLF